MEPSTQQSSSAIPIAIICGFALIAIAIFFTSKNVELPALVSGQDASESTSPGTARPIDKSDYIRGNPNAPILMIEYSDYDCPFCKQYHATMNQIMNEYGITGKLAWVYRQFPLTQLHPNSPKISEAALCVGSIGGNDAFWKFTDKIFEERDIDDATNVTKLPQYAEAAGVSLTDFTSCVESNKMEETVLKSIEDGFNAGARGTPYTILIVGNQQAVITGAQPYDVVKGIVTTLIDQLNGVENKVPPAPTTPETNPTTPAN
ncbi:MAG: hypothetical protein RLZZ230_200 [Candidatus Parcubacteria bacterium]|jgi:protein-disulfide isomerase